jgi:hypothetical protein
VSPNGYRVLSPSSAEDKNEWSFIFTPPIRRQVVDRGNFAFELNALLFESMAQVFVRRSEEICSIVFDPKVH